MFEKAPIVFFCYARPWHTFRALTALSENLLSENSRLFIFCDGPKPEADENQLRNIQEVREIVKSKNWCGEVHIIIREKNFGLANSVIQGVSQIVEKYSKVIVLEDDLIPSPYFLEYMNTALDYYNDNEKVMQISGYNFPVEIKNTDDCFFLPLATSWGWGTWKKSWDYFDSSASGYIDLKVDPQLRYSFDFGGSYPYSNALLRQMQGGKIDSWAIRWWWSVFKRQGLVLYPHKSLIENIGWDGSGTHKGINNPFMETNNVRNFRVTRYPKNIIEDLKKSEIVRRYLKQLFNTSDKIERRPNLLSRFFMNWKYSFKH